MTDNKTVAYIMQVYPHRTETFISREIDALRACGVQVLTLANQPPAATPVDPKVQTDFDGTHYIFPLSVPRIVQISFAHVRWLFSDGAAYLRCLKALRSEASREHRLWIRNIKHFLGGVYLAWHIRAYAIDHIHAHYTINASSMALYMSILLDIPFSMTVHNIVFTDRLLMRAKLTQAHAIICISEYTRQYLVDQYAATVEDFASKTHVVHCGINPDDFVVVDRPKPVEHPFTILCAAQLVERKGIRYLIDACHELHVNAVQFRCVIAGDGALRPQLQAQVESLGFAEFFTFEGVYTQAALLNYFATADVFVLPCVTAANGDRDGIPIVLMEAMAAGVPVISTRVSGIPELIEDGRNGYLVDEKNPQALADLLSQLARDSALRLRVIDVAHQTIRTEFDGGQSARTLLDLFANRGI